jgi:hypothetical protein
MITTAEGAIVSLLLTDTTVSALVGTRIHPATDPQNVPRPKLTYQRLRTDRSADVGGFTNDGPTGHAVAPMQIDCWADSILTAKQVIAAVRRRLNGYSGTVGGIFIGSIRVVDERELPATIYEGQTKPIQRQMCEIQVSHTDT